MSARTDADHLRDMLHYAEQALSFSEGRSIADLDGDNQFSYALQHCFMIIGEAASHISEPTKERLPTIPWRQIIGMRQWIVHRYDRVDDAVLWKTTSEDLPELIAQILQFLPPEHN